MAIGNLYSNIQRNLHFTLMKTFVLPIPNGNGNVYTERPTFSSNGECLPEMFLPMAVVDSCAKHYLSCLRLELTQEKVKAIPSHGHHDDLFIFSGLSWQPQTQSLLSCITCFGVKPWSHADNH